MEQKIYRKEPSEINRNTKLIEEHLGVFNNLLINILQRRGFFRVFENNLIGKAPDIIVKENKFINFYTMDYTRNQIVDLRKFFETDKNSYKISFLVDNLSNEQLKSNHKKLFQCWDKNFKDQANKLIMHLDQKTESLARAINKSDLDRFIDDLNMFFDNIVGGFCNRGDKVIYDEVYRNGEFLIKEARESFSQYLIMTRNESILKRLFSRFLPRFNKTLPLER